MRSGHFSVVAFAILAFIAARADAVSLLVQPNRLYLTGQRGATMEQEIAISSLEARDVPVKLEIESFILDQDGRPLHRPSATPAEWAALPATDAVIRRGERLSFHLHLKIPMDASGTLWCALLIETPLESLHGGARIRSRVAVPIFLTVEGTESISAQIEELRAASSSAEEIIVAVRVRNTGNTALRAPMTIAIEQNQSGQAVELATTEQPEFVILPGAVRILTLRISGRFPDVSELSAVAFYRYSDAVATASSHVRRRPSVGAST